MAAPRRLILNGIEIGTLPSTGDMRADAEAAMLFMKERGLYKETSVEHAMFAQAVSFADAALLIYAKHLTKSPYGWLGPAPFVVNASLAAELYLKTLLKKLGLPYGKEHSLKKLFHKLPLDRRSAIMKAAESHEAKYGGRAAKINLAAMDRAFQEWRYIYESQPRYPMKIPELILLLAGLHDVCRAVVNQPA